MKITISIILFLLTPKKKSSPPCIRGAEEYQSVTTFIHRIPFDYIRGLIPALIQILRN